MALVLALLFWVLPSGAEVPCTDSGLNGLRGSVEELNAVADQALVSELEQNGFSRISIREMDNFSESVTGRKPTLVMDLSTIVLDNSGWTLEQTRAAYEGASRILSECGIGFKKMRFINATREPASFHFIMNSRCLRERGRPFRCDPAPEKSAGTSAEIALASLPVGRPAVIMTGADTSNIAAGWSTYQREGLEPLRIRPPISDEEQKHLDFYNQTRHVTVVSQTREDHAKVMAHELAHQLLGSCGDESPKRGHHGLGGLMGTDSSTDVKHLCPLLRKSKLLKPNP